MLHARGIKVAVAKNMTLIICPGIHDEALSDRFVAALETKLHGLETPPTLLRVPSQRYAPFDGLGIWSYLQTVATPERSLLFIAFSAGVVGAVAAANLWQGQGRKVAALIALDGWGVPQFGAFPLHRVSHDHFTHWSSAMLGAGQDSFYADPPVPHLDLWQTPETVSGYRITVGGAPSGTTFPTTALDFIVKLVERYR